jgi:hypothetical protein
MAVVDDELWLLGLDAAAADVAALPEPPGELLPQAARRTVNTANAGSIHLR